MKPVNATIASDIHEQSKSNVLVKTKYYTISYNSIKNRIYFSVYGRWTGLNLIPDFFSDWQETVSKMQPHFTVISDARQMQPQSLQIEKLHQKVHFYLMENGLLQAAKIISLNDIVNLQASRIEAKTNLPNNKFTSLEQAEEYLDGLTEN